MRQNRPIMIEGHAKSWPAMHWYNITNRFGYLKQKIGGTSIQASRISVLYRNNDAEIILGSSPMNIPFQRALDMYLNNTTPDKKKVSEDEEGNIVERKDIVYIENQDISAKARDLTKSDVIRPPFLDNILRH